MNWIKEATNDLKNHKERKEGIENIREQIKILEEEYISLKGIKCDAPIKDYKTKQEENRINNIAKCEKLKSNLLALERTVKLIEKGLSSLSDTDRYILELFYIDRPSDYKDRLCERFNVEEAQIYRMKDSALKNFTISMYGITEF